MQDFTYSRFFPNLVQFYNSMKEMGVLVGTFDHSYNSIISDVIFDTRTEPYKLIFLKRGKGCVYKTEMENHFSFSIKGSAAYYELLDYFEIGKSDRGKGKFHISQLSDSIHNQTPQRYHLTDRKREVVATYMPQGKNERGIYPIGLINWYKFHAEHPDVDPKKYHRQTENLEYTRQLYPALYETTRTLDISIKYGGQKNEKTEKILNLDLLD